jgi:hypothetical protein
MLFRLLNIISLPILMRCAIIMMLLLLIEALLMLLILLLLLPLPLQLPVTKCLFIALMSTSNITSVRHRT